MRFVHAHESSGISPEALEAGRPCPDPSQGNGGGEELGGRVWHDDGDRCVAQTEGAKE